MLYFLYIDLSRIDWQMFYNYYILKQNLRGIITKKFPWIVVEKKNGPVNRFPQHALGALYPECAEESCWLSLFNPALTAWLKLSSSNWPLFVVSFNLFNLDIFGNYLYESARKNSLEYRCPKSTAFFGVRCRRYTQNTPRKAVDSFLFWPSKS